MFDSNDSLSWCAQEFALRADAVPTEKKKS